MTKEEEQVEAKLQQLEAQLLRNECLMRKVLINYEEILSAKASLLASIQALRDFRKARRRNFRKVLNSKSAGQYARSLE